MTETALMELLQGRLTIAVEKAAANVPWIVLQRDDLVKIATAASHARAEIIETAHVELDVDRIVAHMDFVADGWPGVLTPYMPMFARDLSYHASEQPEGTIMCSSAPRLYASRLVSTFRMFAQVTAIYLNMQQAEIPYRNLSQRELRKVRIRDD